MDITNRFFAAIDSDGAFMDIAEMLANSSDHIPDFADCMVGFRKWLRTPIDQRSADIVQRLELPPVKTVFDGQPVDAAIFGATVYRFASTILANHGSFATISERLQDGATPNAINNFIAKNPRFVGEILIDSTLRANRDKKFLDGLNASIDELKGIVDTLPQLPSGIRLLRFA